MTYNNFTLSIIYFLTAALSRAFLPSVNFILSSSVRLLLILVMTPVPKVKSPNRNVNLCPASHTIGFTSLNFRLKQNNEVISCIVYMKISAGWKYLRCVFTRHNHLLIRDDNLCCTIPSH